MPCTFSHPLAAVLLHRLAPSRLELSALIVGSMAPDFGYYTGHFAAARFAHTIPGTILISLPTGLLALCLVYLLRKPFCFLLPQPHRGALWATASSSVPLKWKRLSIVLGSLLLGTWTHSIWDSCTHDGAWTVERIGFLQETVLHISNSPLSVAYLLQQTSTFGAAAALLFLYVSWLKRQPATLQENGSDRWRYLWFTGVIFVALAVASPFAWQKASYYEGYTALRVLLFRTAIYSSATFFALVTMSCLAVLVFRKEIAVMKSTR